MQFLNIFAYRFVELDDHKLVAYGVCRLRPFWSHLFTICRAVLTGLSR